jgi:DNA-binding transcriptional ArsR family regulator
MVEYTLQLDFIFSSLSDPTRRDIIARVARQEYSVGELAAHYQVSFAAISKHLKVLENAKLISKRKEGKKHIVTVNPAALRTADEYLKNYQKLWEGRFDRLETFLK